MKHFAVRMNKVDRNICNEERGLPGEITKNKKEVTCVACIKFFRGGEDGRQKTGKISRKHIKRR